MNAILHVDGREVLRGTPEHDAAIGSLLLVLLTDDYCPQGKRRRSELALSLEQGEPAQGLVLEV